jgi:hypothetical protein
MHSEPALAHEHVDPVEPGGAQRDQYDVRRDLRLVHRSLPPGQAQVHATGWQHFLPRLASAAAGDDPGPDLWEQERPPGP